MGEVDIAGVAAAIGDVSRARVLMALAAGAALPAGVLAAEAGVGASTISGHLARLREAKLVTVELDGRHRYYRLASRDVARALEELARIAQPLPVDSLRADSRGRALLRGRLCYDHLAGRLGVALMAGLREREILVAEGEAYRLTEHGREELGAFGVDIPEGSVRYCVDWGEGRHHLAGALGSAVADRLFEVGWLRRGRARRVVHLTEAGRHGVVETFAVPAGALD